MMKRKLLFGATLLLLSWAATSCEAISGCKICKNVKYERGAVLESGPETEYCGADLIAKEATPDVTIGTVTTKVECR
jgi:hypothetical protein